jgi:hypothetical protein
MVLSLGITMGAGFALAGDESEGEHGHEAGKYEVTFSSNPSFPVAAKSGEF